jgi:hypothetical protein
MEDLHIFQSMHAVPCLTVLCKTLRYVQVTVGENSTAGMDTFGYLPLILGPRTARSIKVTVYSGTAFCQLLWASDLS